MFLRLWGGLHAALELKLDEPRHQKGVLLSVDSTMMPHLGSAVKGSAFSVLCRPLAEDEPKRFEACLVRDPAI